MNGNFSSAVTVSAENRINHHLQHTQKQNLNARKTDVASAFASDVSPMEYLEKLTDRNADWSDRRHSLEVIGKNLGVNPLFNNILLPLNIPNLLCSWATQLLDNKFEVKETTMNLLPNVIHECLDKGNKQITMAYLQEIFNNLFNIMDDIYIDKAYTKYFAGDVISKVVDDIINSQDLGILYICDSS